MQWLPPQWNPSPWGPGRGCHTAASSICGQQQPRNVGLQRVHLYQPRERRRVWGMRIWPTASTPGPSTRAAGNHHLSRSTVPAAASRVPAGEQRHAVPCVHDDRDATTAAAAADEDDAATHAHHHQCYGSGSTVGLQRVHF